MRLMPTRSTVTQLCVGAAVGATTWSATEYAVHRWVLHGPFGRGRLSKVPIGGLHRQHHADPDHTVGAARLAGHGAMLAVGATAATALSGVLPTVLARSAALTWSSGYSVYDLVHHRLHHRAPSTSFGRRLRQRHFRHHFGAPGTNLGVTTAWLDRVFGTEAPSGPVRVSDRLAPDWLSELGDEFVSVGTHRG